MGLKSMLYGRDDFFNYYASIGALHSQDPSKLFDYLSIETLPVLRFNPKHTELLKNLWIEKYDWIPLDWYPHALQWPSHVAVGTYLPGHKEHMHYAMNPSSLLPVIALDISPDDVVLDAAAAPGGKALMIAEKVFAGEGHLVANDLSKDRLGRMQRMFRDYGYGKYVEYSNLPAETLYKDAQGMFDKILLDAPCSSEKHIYASEDRIDTWSYGRIKQLRSRQYRMIDSLIKCLKPSGRLVYATCALSPDENEAVVAKVLKNRSQMVKHLPYDWTGMPGTSGIAAAYDTEFDLQAVRRVWPDEHYDPMFVAVFEKI